MFWIAIVVLLTALLALYVQPKQADSHKEIYKWVKNRVQVSEKFRNELEWEFERLGLDDTPEDLKARQWLLGGVALVSFIVLAIAFWHPVWLLFGAGVAAFFYYFPVLHINKAIKAKQNALYEELPEFIDLIILLLRAGLTPYQAIKQAVGQSDFNALQTDLERLSTDIDMMNEGAALERFATYAGIPEARQFVRAMWQATATDRDHADEIFTNQTEVMRQLRQQRNRQTIKEKPLKVRFVSLGVFGFILAIPLGVFVINFIQMFSSFSS